MNIKNKIKTENLAENLFLLGIFLLASAMSIGIILILISSIIYISNSKENLLKDKWAIFLILISVFMLISSIYQTYNQANKDLIEWDISLTWIGLLNWIPFFYLFISTKNFVATSLKDTK